jgi:hypothetical protein
MNQLARVLTLVPMIGILSAMADCGSIDSPAPWDTDGGAVGSGGGSTSGSTPTGASGSGSSSSGSVTSSGSSGGVGRSNDGGASLVLADGGLAGGGPEQCFTLNSTRSCCGGSQVCMGSGEFNYWGPCLDTKGGPAFCPPPPCSAAEGRPCDAGPPPPPPPPPPAICNDPAISTEPEILVGYSPSLGQTVGLHGQIKVWVNDENPPFIAPGEQFDHMTGAVLAPGNRTATAPDGLLWEPALYIAPQTPQNGGTPHFPQWFKGWIDNNPPPGGRSFQVPGMDPVPPGAKLAEKYTGEDIWDVSSLGLGPGTYTAVFVVHDGDDDRAIGCVTIVITP